MADDTWAFRTQAIGNQTVGKKLLDRRHDQYLASKSGRAGGTASDPELVEGIERLFEGRIGCPAIGCRLRRVSRRQGRPRENDSQPVAATQSPISEPISPLTKCRGGAT